MTLNSVDKTQRLIERLVAAVAAVTRMKGSCSDAELLAEGFTAEEIETCAAEARRRVKLVSTAD